MGPLAIDHVQLAMPEGGEDLACEFYAGVLGLSEVAKPASLAVNGGAWFRSGEVELHLGREHDFRPARKAHPALVVRDLDRLAVTCRAYGTDVTWDEHYPGVRRFYVDDPFGNRLEIMQAPADPQPTAAERALITQALGNIAYRAREAVSGAPEEFADFEAGDGARTPLRLLRHIRGVIGAARAGLVGETYLAEPLPTLSEEADALNEAIVDLAQQIHHGTWTPPNTPSRLLQGPIAEATTYVGQLEMLKQLSGYPNSLRLTTASLIEAPAVAVWEAWTDPAKIARWWGPAGFTSDVHELEVAYGGRYVVTMRAPDGATFENTYEFESAEPYVRIVFRHLGSERHGLAPYRSECTLENEGASTRVTLTTRYASEEEKLKHVERFGAEEGSRQQLARLGEVAAEAADRE